MYLTRILFCRVGVQNAVLHNLKLFYYLQFQSKMVDLRRCERSNRQLCHSNNHPSKTQTIHLLLVMLFTLSSVLASLKKFREEAFECPVCLEPCTDTLVNPECNHRFCKNCIIKESLHKCNHECPTCRAHIPTCRTCRRDPQFDHIVSTETK